MKLSKIPLINSSAKVLNSSSYMGNELCAIIDSSNLLNLLYQSQTRVLISSRNFPKFVATDNSISNWFVLLISWVDLLFT